VQQLEVYDGTISYFGKEEGRFVSGCNSHTSHWGGNKPWNVNFIVNSFEDHQELLMNVIGSILIILF
jgi:hypothetical protein